MGIEVITPKWQSDHIEDEMPQFIYDTEREITTTVNTTAYMHCHVGNLEDRSVSYS